mgnify:CR=1 FL=1
MKKNSFYILHLQYLGFRFHGWAKQPGIKTVHHMVDRTLKFVFEDQAFKTLGGSRTDAMVSAEHFMLELFLDEPLADEDAFVEKINFNLPADIRLLAIEATNAKFNIIQHAKIKRYLYLFAHGEKAHPFSAPFLTTLQQPLDVAIMAKGAKMFEGQHEFKAYCKKPKENTTTFRTVKRCELVDNTFYNASFFPSPSYAVIFESKGFMRNQIRMMMGELFRLGNGEITIEQLENSLKPGFNRHLDRVAPASGLILHQIIADKNE